MRDEETGFSYEGLPPWVPRVAAVSKLRREGKPYLPPPDPEVMMAHEEGIIRCFVEEYERCGGPKLPLEEVLLRFHLAYITNVYECNSWLERQVYKESPKDEFLAF